MSKFTTEVRFICEQSAGLLESEGYNSLDEILTKAYPIIFNFDFPIFDETYRPVLLKKILKHYYTREIGEETVGLWKLRLDTRLNEIMPYYNKLYESELLNFNPLYETDYNITYNKTGQQVGNETSNLTDTNTGKVERDDNVSETNVSTDVGNSNSSTASSSNENTNSQTANKNDHWDYYSDTPQGTVSNLVNNTYLTNARHIVDDTDGSKVSTATMHNKTDNSKNSYDAKSQNNSTNILDSDISTKNSRTMNNRTDNTINNTEDYAKHVVGKFPGKSYSKLLQEFRESFLNIDVMVINELSDLFFGLWE